MAAVCPDCKRFSSWKFIYFHSFIHSTRLGSPTACSLIHSQSERQAPTSIIDLFSMVVGYTKYGWYYSNSGCVAGRNSCSAATDDVLWMNVDRDTLSMTGGGIVECTAVQCVTLRCARLFTFFFYSLFDFISPGLHTAQRCSSSSTAYLLLSDSMTLIVVKLMVMVVAYNIATHTHTICADNTREAVTGFYNELMHFYVFSLT